MMKTFMKCFKFDLKNIHSQWYLIIDDQLKEI